MLAEWNLHVSGESLFLNTNCWEVTLRERLLPSCPVYGFLETSDWSLCNIGDCITALRAEVEGRALNDLMVQEPHHVSCPKLSEKESQQ